MEFIGCVEAVSCAFQPEILAGKTELETPT